jgi:hypothetical protein
MPREIATLAPLPPLNRSVFRIVIFRRRFKPYFVGATRDKLLALAKRAGQMTGQKDLPGKSGGEQIPTPRR